MGDYSDKCRNKRQRQYCSVNLLLRIINLKKSIIPSGSKGGQELVEAAGGHLETEPRCHRLQGCSVPLENGIFLPVLPLFALVG